MAHLLAKLGKEALRPQNVGGVWRKAAVSAKNVARLRKEALLEGREWEFDEPRATPRQRKPKGHKHDRERPAREAAIAAKLEGADARIEAARAARRAGALLEKATPLDRLLLRPEELRLKQRGL